MTLGEMIKHAVDRDDHVMAARVVNILRFKHGLNYDRIFWMVHNQRPKMTEAKWDELLYRADCEETRR